MTPPDDRDDRARESGAAGRFAYDGLDRVIHERARLGVLASLVAHPKGLPFNDLKQLCSLTDGNLSRHLHVLQEERLVEIDKRFEGNRPLTTVRLTRSGRQRFLDYVAVLEKVVRDAAGTGARETAGTRDAAGEDRGAGRTGSTTPPRNRLKPA